MNFTQKIESLLKDDKYKLSNSILYVKNLVWIPLAKIDDVNTIYIFFSRKFKKENIKLIKIFSDNNLYLVSPKLSDPKSNRLSKKQMNILNIRNYLRNYLKFYDDFKKIKFDLISNLTKYCHKENCFDLIKDIHSEMNIDVQRKYYNWVQKNYYYNYSEEIRNDFSSLYRDIVINQILYNS